MLSIIMWVDSHTKQWSHNGVACAVIIIAISIQVGEMTDQKCDKLLPI